VVAVLPNLTVGTEYQGADTSQKPILPTQISLGDEIGVPGLLISEVRPYSLL